MEAAGMSTLSMSSALDITEAVWPPRAAFLDFPLGHTAGKAGDAELQLAVVRAALGAFERLDAPGLVEHLPFRWSEDDDWKESAMRGGDDRQPRLETPQYQHEDDRRLAEACGACAPAPRG
jgi:hypothetical protein